MNYQNEMKYLYYLMKSSNFSWFSTYNNGGIVTLLLPVYKLYMNKNYIFNTDSLPDSDRGAT